MIKIRIDVDYPYPSRLRSFIYTSLGIRVGSDYLKNSKIVAKMINESTKDVKAYWFFTPKTIPDKELLGLLDNVKHEVALHVVNDPFRELKLLEMSTGKKINFYTIHGTARLLARMMWRRWKAKAPKIPEDFPLQSFHEFPTQGLDSLCCKNKTDEAIRIAEKWLADGYVLYFHPIWLFQRGRINHRSRFYETLKHILDVDKELDNVTVRKKHFFKIATVATEYQKDVIPTEAFLEKLGERGTDIFNFIERKWSHTALNPPKSWIKGNDNIALFQTATYDEWWKSIGKKTRNMIRKAEKSGIKTELAEPNEKLAEGIWKIYNETPIRQERAFPHYGISLKAVKQDVVSAGNSTYIGAYFESELAGFIQLVHGDNIAIISQILSLQKHWDKAVNNALVAKTIEVCSNRRVRWIMYGRMGNHPSLDTFKQNNGFTRCQLTRYYVPLTRKGKIATRLGLHKELKDALPQSVKYPLIPFYNWISRTKMKIK